MSLVTKKKVQVVVFHEDEVLIFQVNQKRGSFWQNITGSVDGDETFDEAARREFKEETGQKDVEKLQPIDYKFEFIDESRATKYLEQSYLAIIGDKFNPVLDPNEHQSHKWAKIEDVNINDYKFKSNFEAFLIAKSFYHS